MDRPTPSPCGSDDMPDDDTVDAALFEGHVDAIEAGRIYGWALDPSAPSERLSVTIFHGDEELGTVVADRYREDLRRYGDGSGKHAFVFTLPKPLWDADPAGFHVTHAGSSVPLVRLDGGARKVPAAAAEAHAGSPGATTPGVPGGAAIQSPGGAPNWLAPVAARLSHLETALVSTARAAALTQIGLREVAGAERDERLAAVEEAQLRIDRSLKQQAADLAELRAELQGLRWRGRAQLALTLLLLTAVTALAGLLYGPAAGLLP